MTLPISRIRKKIFRSDFIKHVFVLFSGTTIGQLIPVLISPILSRLYEPADFGLLGLYVSISTIFSVASTARYDKAIMLPKNKTDSLNLLALSILISLGVSIATFLIVLLFNEGLSDLLNNQDISPWLYFLPLSVLFLGIFQSFNNWSNRQKQYKRIAFSKVSKGSTTGVVNLSVGAVNPGPFGLIGGYIIGHFFASFYLTFKTLTQSKSFFSSISLKKIIENGKRYKRFPIFMIWSSWINSLSMHSPVLLLSYFFNSTIVGYYTFAYKILSLPVASIGSAIGQVFYQRAAENDQKNLNITNISFNVYKHLFFLAVVPASILLVYGDVIFLFVFGEEWLMAGKYAQALSIWLLFVFVTAPLKNIVNVLEKQDKDLKFNVITIILRVVALIVGALIFEDNFIAVLLFGIVSAIALFTYCLYLLYLINLKTRKIFLFTILRLSSVVAILWASRYLLKL